MKVKLFSVLMVFCTNFFILNNFAYADRVDDLIYQLLHGQTWQDKLNAAKALDKTGDARAVEPLITALSDSSIAVRYYAADALAKIGKPAVEPLIAAFSYSDSHACRNIVPALVKIGEPTVEPLIAALSDSSNHVRWYVASALGKIGEPAVEPLITALSDSDCEIREYAADALGKIGDARAVEPLITALSDSSYGVREYAASALGKIGDARAVEPLITALSDSSYSVRGHAAFALGIIGDARAVEPLITALSDSDYYVRGRATSALQEFIRSGKGSEEAINLAKQTLQKLGAEIPETIVKQPEEPQTPVEIVQPKEKSTEELLANLSSQDKKVVINAIEKLGERKAVEAVEPILVLLGKDDTNIQNACLTALENISPDVKDEALKNVIAGVLDLLKTEILQDKIAAIKRLGTLKDKRALPVLVRALGMDGSEVRLAALDAIVGYGKDALDVLENYKDDVKAGTAVSYVIDTINQDIKMTAEKEKEETLASLQSEDKNAVISAIAKVKENKIIEATEPLLSLLGNIDEEIRDNSRDALAQIKEGIQDGNLKALVDNAIIVSTPDTSKEEKITAIQELGELNDIRAVDVLARTLADKDIDVKFASLKSLVAMGKDAIEPLQKYVEDSQVSNEVKFILSQISYKDTQTGYALISPQQEEDVPAYAIDTSTVNGELNFYF